ncbi:hypothetical protein [Stygiolobus azoricus]|nr:hypothetical protein [Stygiolobus azoricus]
MSAKGGVGKSIISSLLA